MYKIEDLVTDKNRELYQQLTSKLTIKLNQAPSSDGYWGAVLEDESTGRVDWCCVPHPEACFTHELLHLYFDLAGKAKPGFKLDANVRSHTEYDRLQEWVSSFMSYAYNQMIHRKMFPEFIRMGFVPDQFTADEDAVALAQVENSLLQMREVKRFGSTLTIQDWGMPFLSLMDMASGCKRQRQLLTKLKQMMKPKDAALMTKLLRDFDCDNNPSMPTYLARLMAFIPNTKISVGYSDDSLVTWP